MATLYRKYRPQNFDEVVGQNHIKTTLKNEIQSGRIAHAYLFCGPRAVGKTTLARVMAKAVNCLNRKETESEPCDKCEICQEITAGRSLDIIEIDAASHTGVDNVRENIIVSARVSPSRCKYKIFIIDEVHMLSISAFNALLKIIEEPPARVIFILCTTEIHKVPATIISRCQRFDFRRISPIDVVKKLNYIITKEGIKIDNKILESIARKSEGYMRDAESLLGQIVSIGGKEITQEEADLVIPRSNFAEIINLIAYLDKKDGANSIGLVNKLVDDGVNLTAFVSDLIEVLRKMMLEKINPGFLGAEFGETFEIKINELSQSLSLEQTVAFIEKFVKVKNELKDSFIIQLPIELAIAELCSAISVRVAPIVSPTSFVAPRAPQVPQTPQAPQSFSPAKEPVKQPSIPATPAMQGAGGEIALEEILGKWHEVLTRIKTYNHSLSFILRVCQPIGINGRELCLAFKYKFHRDRIHNEQIKLLVEKILSEVYGGTLMIQTVIDENLEVSANNLVAPAVEEEKPAVEEKAGETTQQVQGGEASGEGPNMLDNLLKTFGGKVVR